MFELLQYEFMRNGLLAAVLVSIACGIVGSFVVVKRIGESIPRRVADRVSKLGIDRADFYLRSQLIFGFLDRRLDLRIGFGCCRTSLRTGVFSAEDYWLAPGHR